MSTRITARLLSTLFFVATCSLLSPGQIIREEHDGIVIGTSERVGGTRSLKLRIWSDNVIQVVAAPGDRFSTRRSLVITGSPPPVPGWHAHEDEHHVTISTRAISARIDRKTLQIDFADSSGRSVLSEDNRSVEPAVTGEDCYSIKQSFRHETREGLYGLGSFQDGDMMLNGKKIALIQKNREDVVPVLVSTNHYGLIWDNYSYSEFNDTRGSYYLWSEVADEIDYFFIYGKNIDSIVSSYRKLTGAAPMYPRWAFGYIQSKQKYNTQDEIVSIVKGFRERRFPLDLIVQDWMYWPEGEWGQKSFNRKNYPDPAKMVTDIHNMNARIIISIWPNMTKGTPNQTELANTNGLFNDSEHVNILKPEARALYWKQVSDSLFSCGIDGWWADCSEGYDSDWLRPLFFKLPDQTSNGADVKYLKWMMGSGRFINVYALMHTQGLYEGQRSTTSKKRVYILTRSSFAGMQRFGASYWTGDVSANWEEFRMQIPAGLNFCMTGVPYWTTDIAGYFIKHQPGWWFSNGAFEKGLEDEGFKELYTRWFQFAAFCPLFRAHGADVPREPWSFGHAESRTYQTLLKFTNLRYRLMPYIYSLAWKITSEGFTIMRALPFDFMHDSTVFTINDQYMFGPSIMVGPVVKPLYYYPNNIRIDSSRYTREIYLPKGTDWFDFWTGEKFEGGRTVEADASYETMPLFVRAGSIIPMGPFIQYSTEKNDPIEIRIYPGANGEFTLYEDENDNYEYLNGRFSVTSFQWNNAEKRFTIGARKGSYPAMRKEHRFDIVLVGDNKGIGIDVCPLPDGTIMYSGKRAVADFR